MFNSQLDMHMDLFDQSEGEAASNEDGDQDVGSLDETEDKAARNLSGGAHAVTNAASAPSINNEENEHEHGRDRNMSITGSESQHSGLHETTKRDAPASFDTKPWDEVSLMKIEIIVFVTWMVIMWLGADFRFFPAVVNAALITFMIRWGLKHRVPSDQATAAKIQQDDSRVVRQPDAAEAEKHRREEEFKDWQAARLKASQLLGLIGAPALNLAPSSTSTSKSTSELHHCQHAGQADVDKVRKTKIPRSIPSDQLLDFLSSHAQLLLSIDQAYDYLRSSSSLHLGLGPRSQCVERIELAMIGRYRQQCQRFERASTQTTHIDASDNRIANTPGRRDDGDDGFLQNTRLQKGASKVLCLSSTRSSIAQHLVEQHNQLVHLSEQWSQQLRQRKRFGNDDDNDSFSWGAEILSKSAIEIPDIISLHWIKRMRSDNAALLGSLVSDGMMRHDARIALGDENNFTEDMRHSTQSATEAHYHIRSVLLIPLTLTMDDGGNEIRSEETTGQMMQKVRKNCRSDPLIQNLIQLDEQVGALQASVWACHRLAAGTSMDDDTSTENDATAEFVPWWNKVKELCHTVQSLQEHIDSVCIDFSSATVDEADGNGDPMADSAESPMDSTKRSASSQQEYEHDSTIDGPQRNGGDPNRNESPEHSDTVFVFAGSGTKAKQRRKVQKQPLHRGSNDTATPIAPMPQRNVIMEQLLVHELQSRIQIMEPLKEVQIIKGDSRTATTGPEDAPASVERQNPTSKATPSQPQRRQKSSPFFLGASGSLLQELQQSIAVDSNEIVDE